MKAVLITLGLVFGLLLAVAGIAVSNYFSWANFGAAIEAQLEGQETQNKNVLAQGSQKVLEAAQVPEMYRDDVIKTAQAAIQGRYGAEGSKAVFQMLREQNPNLDSKVYTKIQQLIEAFRTEFQNSQQTLIDLKRSFKTKLDQPWSGFWLHLAGYPKRSLDSYVIVTTDYADDSFKTGKEKGLTLRPVK